MNWRRYHLDDDPKHRKEWRADRGRYRIVWRDEFMGVEMSPGYHAVFKELLPGGRAIWEKVDRTRKRLFKTKNAAMTACLKHKKRNDK